MLVLTRDDVRSLTASDLIDGEWMDSQSVAIFLGQEPRKGKMLTKSLAFPAPERRLDGVDLWRIAGVAAWAEKHVSPEPRDESTCLYRHFDGDGRLLYVGISLSPTYRSSQHRTRSSWYRAVANITVEWFPSRRAAEAAENAAIAQENPIHNITRKPK